jgi:hypothetical protein
MPIIDTLSSSRSPYSFPFYFVGSILDTVHYLPPSSAGPYDYLNASALALASEDITAAIETSHPLPHYWPHSSVESMEDGGGTPSPFSTYDDLSVGAPILSSEGITGDSVLEASLRRDIDTWLSASDTSRTHNRLQEKHHEGTCLWFLDSEALETWMNTPGSILWMRGLRES